MVRHFINLHELVNSFYNYKSCQSRATLGNFFNQHVRLKEDDAHARFADGSVISGTDFDQNQSSMVAVNRSTKHIDYELSISLCMVISELIAAYTN